VLDSGSGCRGRNHFRWAPGSPASICVACFDGQLCGIKPHEQLSIVKFKAFQQGEMMKKSYLTVVLILTCLLGLRKCPRRTGQRTLGRDL
jgi:hypothetical protein